MNKKSYLIIGGSSGIGLAIAKKIAEEGNAVILVGSSENKLESALNELKGEKHLAYRYDLRDVENIENIFKYIQKNEIKLSGMVYCAGIAPLCLLKDQTPSLIEEVFNINYFSFIESVKYFYKEEYSYDYTKIVAVSSITAHGAGYRQTLYGSSKAAMVAAVKLMAKELLNRNIQINALSPGVTDTEMLSDLRKKSANLDEKIRLSQPLGVIEPDKIANMVKMLLSVDAEYLTGTEIVYDAGAMLK